MLTLVIQFVVVQLVVFAVVVVVLKRVLLHDTLEAVQRLRDVEAEIRKKEDGIKRRVEELEKEYDGKKAEVEEELRRRREQLDREMESVKERVAQDARGEAERIVAEAHRAKDKIRQELEREVEGRAIEGAGQVCEAVFSEKVSAAVDAVFVDELLGALAEVDGSAITVDASETEFVAGHPLEGHQRARLRKLLDEKFGVEVEVQERVDPALLGGLTIKVGSIEIDGSLRTRLREGFAALRQAKGL